MLVVYLCQCLLSTYANACCLGFHTFKMFSMCLLLWQTPRTIVTIAEWQLWSLPSVYIANIRGIECLLALNDCHLNYLWNAVWQYVNMSLSVCVCVCWRVRYTSTASRQLYCDTVGHCHSHNGHLSRHRRRMGRMNRMKSKVYYLLLAIHARIIRYLGLCLPVKWALLLVYIYVYVL